MKPPAPTESAYRRIAEVFERSQTILVTTHIQPDGDALGTEAAVAEAIAQMGKHALVLNDEPVPERYRFLSQTRSFQVYRENEHARLIAGADAAMLVDAALPDRTGRLASVLAAFRGETIAIDHHQYGGWAQVEIVDSRACATADLVHELIDRLPVDMTPSMAEALYTGLAFDTQGFRTSHTTPEAHRRAARLLEMGVDMERVHVALFSSWALERLRLLGEFLAGLRVAAAGQIVWGVVGESQLRQRGLDAEALEGFVERAFAVAGAKLAILFHEQGENVRLSMRSREGVEVSRLAEALGGGGHLMAAGAIVSAEQAATMRRVLDKAS